MKHNRAYTGKFYEGNHLSFCIAVAATFCNTLLGFAITWILQEMLDAAVGVPGAMSLPGLLAGTLGVLFSLLAVKGILYCSKPRFLKKAMTQFKNYVFGRLMEKSILSFRRESESDYLSAFSNDMTTIENNYLDAQFLLVRNAIEMTGALAMMLWYNPLMTAIAMGFLILPTLAAALQGHRMEDAEKQVSRHNARSVALLRDCLSGFSVIKSFAAERRMAEIMDSRIEKTEAAKCRKRKITTVLEAIGSLSALSAQLGTFLTGTVLILSGVHMTPGVLVAFMDLTATFIDPVSELPELMGNRKAAGGLIDSLSQSLREGIRSSGAPAPGQLRQGITLSHLTYGYQEGTPILRDLSFRFEAGKSYAVVGASGSGKSTLLNLLMGSDGYAGHIRYDDRELQDIHSDSLFDMVSMIQQNVFLFNASIRDNITMFGDFPREALQQAIRLSGLDGLIQDKGQDYLCGEDGCGLSGGEKQRISIARSLLRKSQVLLADEITAALDAATAAQVSDAILNLQGMTRIVVTHALDEGLLRRYDCILAMKAGEITEWGSFEGLMERKGYFYSLYTVSQ